jgi:hypothetical protein
LPAGFTVTKPLTAEDAENAEQYQRVFSAPSAFSAVKGSWRLKSLT